MCIRDRNYGGGSTVCAAAQNLLRAATSAMLNEAYYGSKYPPYSSAQELITACLLYTSRCV